MNSDADRLLKRYLRGALAELGSGPSSTGAVDAAGRRALGDLWHGVFDARGPPGGAVPGRCVYVINTALAPHPGHWVAVAHEPGHSPLVYDSLAGAAGRPAALGGAATELYGETREQNRGDTHCGALCVAWARLWREKGRAVARAV